MPSPESPPPGLVARCAWCHRVRTEHGWREAPPGLDPALVTHTICPDCEVQLRSAGRSV